MRFALETGKTVESQRDETVESQRDETVFPVSLRSTKMVSLFGARSVLNTCLWCSVRVSVARNQRPDVPSARPLRQSLSCCPQGRRNDNMLFKGEVRTKRRMSCRLGQPHRTTQQRRTTKRSRPGPRWPGGMTWQYRARSSDSEAVSIRTVIVA